MALFINTNTSSLFVQRKLADTGNALDVTFKRISSGLRVNSAADDAAGLQISDRLESQILGLRQGNRNASDGISLTQSIEGAMEEIGTMFRRVRTLALQAASDSNSGVDREALQEEVRALTKEVNRIAADTTFGGENVLDGTFDVAIQIGADAIQIVNFNMKNIGGSQNSISASGGFTISGIASIASSLGGRSLTTLAEGISTLDSGMVNDGSFISRFIASSISISNKVNAQYILSGMDSLISVVDQKRAELGALQNRFQSTIRNQANMDENLSAAKARIKDADFALETAQLTRTQIIQQSSLSILSQANQRGQLAMTLLG